MTVLYNDNDANACEWLKNLVAAGHLPAGEVNSCPIESLNPDELAAYNHAHFFAGIGGWPLALRLAGWPDEWPVWTGSCPCQPFSAAGKGLGAADPRHLWPAWFSLIRQRRPEHIFGEQVASAIGHGWLDGVFTDLEAEGYACGAVVLGAHSVGAPHIRQRVYWVANSDPRRRREGRKSGGLPQVCSGEANERVSAEGASANCNNGWVDASKHAQRGQKRGPVEDVGDGDNSGREETHGQLGACGEVCGMDDSPLSRGGTLRRQSKASLEPQVSNRGSGLPNPWSAFDLLPCLDDKSRRVEPGTFPLAHGVPARVVRLRGYGNAIVPQTAAIFVRAFLDTLNP